MFALALNHGPLIINPSPSLSLSLFQSWPVVDSREYSATKYAMYVDERAKRKREREREEEEKREKRETSIVEHTRLRRRGFLLPVFVRD